MLCVLVVFVVTVLEHGRNPDCLTPQTLDVRQLLFESGKVAAVPEGHVANIEAAAVDLIVPGVAIGEAICDQLVDGESSPIGRRWEIRVIVPFAVILSRCERCLKIYVPAGVLDCAWSGLQLLRKEQQEKAE